MNEYLLALSDEEILRYRVMAEMAAQSERDQWGAAGIVEGATVADVGCGPGAVSAVLAKIVGPSGTVYAVDREVQAREAAVRVAAASGVANVVVLEGSASHTGIEAGSVDVVMMRHVLAHNGGHEQDIVDHLATLVRPGGWIYLVDIDATAFRVRPADQFSVFNEMNSTYAELHARLGNDLSVGLRLGELLAAAGLESIEHHGKYEIFSPPPGMRPPNWAARGQLLDAGLIDDGDIQRWTEQFEKIDRGELVITLFASMFSAWGRKPG